MKAQKIAEICAGTVIGNGGAEIKGVCTDTRKNFAGSLYVALAGDRFDGHDFISQALQGGSVAVLWGENDRLEEIKRLRAQNPDAAFIKVDNTLKSLGQVSSEILKKYREDKELSTGIRMPVVAVTGSVGKTTTKEMTALALSAKYDVCKSVGNHNNEIGVPLTIFSLKSENAIVLEFGMRGMGQIEYLTEIARPSVGIITNIGTAHLELLGSRSRIFMAKAEIAAGIPEGGYLIVNGDNDYLNNKELLDAYIAKVFSKKINIISAGESEDCDYRIKILTESENESSFEISYRDASGAEKTQKMALKVPGRHNITDAALAFAAAVVCGADADKVAEKLAGYGSDSLRQKMIEKGGVTVIDDTYNANPESMKAALSVLGRSAGRRIAVLGSMLELGERSALFHNEVGAYAAACADILITAGADAENIAAGFDKEKKNGQNSAIRCENSQKAAEKLLETIKKGDTVLVKGSRGMTMETVVARLCEVQE